MTGGSQSGPSAQFEITKLGPNVSVEQIVDFLGFGGDDASRSSCSVALSACKNFAIVMVPEEFCFRVLERNGEVLEGQNVVVTQINPKPAPNPAATELTTLADVAAATTPMPASQVNAHQGDTHDESMSDDVIVNYVFVDTTRCNDPFNVPSHAAIVHALALQFPKSQDPERVVIRQTGRFEGLWRIETKNINLYAGTRSLVYGGREIGYIDVRREIQRTDDSGGVTRERVWLPRQSFDGQANNDRKEDDLLVTLPQANSERFSFVTDHMILSKIVALGVGDLKKAPQPQKHKGTDELNGNKFFVLENVTEEMAKTIPTHFTFAHDKFGVHKMWLNHRLRRRTCTFCGTEHEAECPTRAIYEKLREERKQMLEANNNRFDVHIISDSTLRYAEQQCVATEVHAMSGATTGNVMNAIDVDKAREEVPNLIIVAGQNELTSDLTDEEFLVVLKHKEERLRSLASHKTVAIMRPPPQTNFDAMRKAKEAIFHYHLSTLEEDIPNLKVWDNPVPTFGEDGGRHPTPDETNTILKFIDSKAKEDLGLSIFLKSGPNDLITNRMKYRGVKSLYKYGCGACADRSRNKWRNVCTNCASAAEEPERSGIASALTVLLAKADEIRDRESPLLPSCQASSHRDRSPLRLESDDVPPDVSPKRIKFCHISDA